MLWADQKMAHSSGTFFNSHITKPLFALITEITGYIISFIWKGISHSTAETSFPRFEHLPSAGKTYDVTIEECEKSAVGRNQTRALALSCRSSITELRQPQALTTF